MGVSKVDYFGETLVDLSEDTVTPETLAEGVTAHGANGDPIVGTMSISSDAVLYTEQTLTEEQKAQARENIGLGDMVLITLTDIDKICGPYLGIWDNILSKTEIEFGYNLGFMMHCAMFNFGSKVYGFEADAVYNVEWDGVWYTTECVKLTDGIFGIGNLSFANALFGSSFADNGLPFCIGILIDASGYNYCYIPKEYSGYRTVGVTTGSGDSTEVIVREAEYRFEFCTDTPVDSYSRSMDIDNVYGELIEGQTYTINIDGVIYEDQARVSTDSRLPGVVYVGNSMTYTGNEDDNNGMPFLIAYFSGDGVSVLIHEKNYHTVEIAKFG